MAGRRLSPEERDLWGRVTDSVRPLPGKRLRTIAAEPQAKTETAGPVAARTGKTQAVPEPAPRPVRRPVDYLDKSWERRISGGTLNADFTIDLHGHTLDAAHRRLSSALAGAIAHRARCLLVVTGKPRSGPVVPGERARGAIRAEIGHWLATNPHADAIASVRTAHPRHGGAGAIYIILRRNN
ncbi:Smr/MutS family protein [Sphingobium subterraneum]|uniref:DNA-nicking Smr family endonuclease n=1 Tax=Sphingobium subterraneum TaxID=627688 RepID=A0A841J714_9SPHN|nr:Smr/MutS family protein [Sphingobium subterraneum]MBB6124338.1 DNA-nicking Smr family endonuclease [Sphingobium subterraneum]